MDRADASTKRSSHYLEEGLLHGRRTGILENDAVRLEFLLDAGPRIVSLRHHDRPQNVLSETPQLSWPTNFGSNFEVIGGHRLWAAPEAPANEQVPDNERVDVVQRADGVELVGGTLTREGFRRRMIVRLDGSAHGVRVEHKLTNEGDRTHDIAPWAITALAVGGVATLPQPTLNVDGQEQLPNRRLVLWPYSSLRDPRLELGDDAIRIHAKPAEGWFKLGYFSLAGAMSYEHRGIRFTKRFDVDAAAEYADGGCNAESFVCDDFVELESLGPRQKVAPGDSIEHVETWSLEIRHRDGWL
jgi:hypothetical protein